MRSGSRIKWRTRAYSLLLLAALMLLALPADAKAAPAQGTVSVESGDNGVAALVKSDDSLGYDTVIAVPKTGYVFSHWQVRGFYNGTFYGTQLTVPRPGKDHSVIFRAIFISADDVTAPGIHTRIGSGEGAVSGDQLIGEKDAFITTTITATPAEGYVFSYWEHAGVKFFESSLQVTAQMSSTSTYTAHFIEEASQNGVYTSVDPSGPAGVTSGDMPRVYNGQTVTQTTIHAYPMSPEYEFDYWEYRRDTLTTEKIYTNNITVKVEDAVDRYTAHFKKKLDADTPGVFTSVNNGIGVDFRGTATGDLVYSPTGPANQQTTIQAFAGQGFLFKHWKVSYGGGASKILTGNPLAVKVENRHDSYVAEFEYVGDDYGVYTQPDSADHGTTSGDTKNVLNGQHVTQTTIQAFPKSDEWVFDHWTQSRDGGPQTTVSSANPYTVKVENARDVYTAVFVPADGRGVTTAVQLVDGDGNPIAGIPGTASGDTPRKVNGALVSQTTLQAFPASNDYRFSHWELSRDNVYQGTVSSSNPYSVKVEDHRDEYTAVFTESSAASGVFTAVSGEGTTAGDALYNPAGGAFQQTTIQAFPKSDEWVFDHWELSRNGGTKATASSANPYTVKVEDARDVYTAVFVPASDSLGVTTAVQLVDGDGNPISGSPGTTAGDARRKVNGALVSQTTLQAFPVSNDYLFSHWTLSRDGVSEGTVSSANPYSVKVEDHVDKYTAIFIETPDNQPVSIDPKPTGIIQGFLDVWRKFSSPSYGTTRGSLSDLAGRVVDGIRSRYAGASATHEQPAAVIRMREKLAEKDLPRDRAEMQELPQSELVSSKGMRFMVKPADTESPTEIASDIVGRRYGSLYGFTLLQNVRITGPIGVGDDPVTLVWKQTGAAYRDNLLLIQLLPDGSQRTATPIADEDGTLTFTLSAADGSDCILIRVYIKENLK